MIARLLLAIACLLGCCAAASAQLQTTNDPSVQGQIRQSYLLQNPGAQVPLDASLIDDTGHVVRLGDYLGSKPALLVLGYFTCPDLCPMTFRHLTEELNGIAPVAGQDFQVIIVSFDSRDTTALAAQQKLNCLRAYKWPATADGWHFLTGHQDQTDRIAKAVGFHYVYNQQQGKFIHPTGVMVLTPGGQISHCFLGIDASPAAMEAAIHDAAAGRFTQVDQPEQQYCVDYDPTITARGRRVTHLLQAGCILWAGLLFGYIGYKIVGDVHRKNAAPLYRSTGPRGRS